MDPRRSGAKGQEPGLHDALGNDGHHTGRGSSLPTGPVCVKVADDPSSGMSAQLTLPTESLLLLLRKQRESKK